jgi:hypothetical protein
MSSLFDELEPDKVSHSDSEDWVVVIRMNLLYAGAYGFLAGKSIDAGDERYRRYKKLCERNNDLLIDILFRSFYHWDLKKFGWIATTKEGTQLKVDQSFPKDAIEIERNLPILCAVTVCELARELKKTILLLGNSDGRKSATANRLIPLDDLKRIVTMVSFIEMFYQGIGIPIKKKSRLAKAKKRFKERIADHIVDIANEQIRKYPLMYILHTRGPRNGEIKRTALANAIASHLLQKGIKKPNALTIYTDYLPELIASGRITIETTIPL